ncbi:MAG: hypothetical protein ACE5RT_02220 [Nitrosopumilaceae archaeon]
MDPKSWNTVFAGIGTILVLALLGMPIQNADALDSTMISKLQSIQNDIESLQENSENFDANKIASQTFKFRAIGESLLEIQNESSLDVSDKEAISTVLDYMISEYKTAFGEYKIQVQEYDRENSVDMKQKLIMKQMIKNFVDFENADENYNKLETSNKFIQSEIKRIQNEEKFQSYINKVAINIADSNNGNKIQKTYHEVALQKIAEEENWILVAPALDRIITQYSNPDVKQHLEMYKEKVLYSIENLEKVQQKQPRILALTNDVDEKTTLFDILFNEDSEILTPSIVLAQLKEEIKSIISESQKIVDEENTRIQEYVEYQNEIAKQNDDNNNVQLEITPEPEPQNQGIGNTDNNPNENASDTAQEKASNEPNDNAINNANDNAKENPKKADNEKAKGKKA